MEGVAVSGGATAVTVPRKPWGRMGLSSLALAVPRLEACNSSPSGRASGVAQAGAAFSQKVTGLPADGPDPDADPVGYALSQIAPLDQIHASDPALQQRLSNLDTAVNKVCPGVAP